MMPRCLLPFAIVAALCAPAAVRAQSAIELMAQGVRAYDMREYAGGAWLLRRALAADDADALPPAQAARALMYLAATELARDQRDSALAAARRHIALDENARPDRGFSRRLAALYEEARRAPAVAAAPPPPPPPPAEVPRRRTPAAPDLGIRLVGENEIRPGADATMLRVTTDAATELSVAIVDDDGRPVRTLFTGPVRDSVDVPWNGLDVSGASPRPGQYTVLVTPAGRDRRAGWVLRLPLEIERAQGELVAAPTPPPAPPDSLLRPERGGNGRAWRSLAPGVLAGVAVVVLPSIIAKDEQPSSGRYLIGATVAAAGIAAFLKQRPGRVIPENAAYNDNLRERWRREAAEVQRRNAERQRQGPLIIRPGEPVLTTPEAS